MSDLCNDNRFELIEKYKKKLIEATNIETAADEMAVLDNILFRLWQMGWLDKLEVSPAQPIAKDTNVPTNDVISRQAALDEFYQYPNVTWTTLDVMEKISELPSAQPELPTGVQDILQYLDEYLHPIVSPEHWSVYSELYDMVSMLPSAQSTDADVQKMQDIEQAMLEKAYECGKQDAEQWIPCSERLPDKPNVYTVTDHEGRVVRYAYYDNESSREYWKRCAKAWMPLPEPYAERKTDETD